jgi:hypothetical protein
MISDEQNLLCDRYRVRPFQSLPNQKVGIARNVKTGLKPVNGLRHPPQGDATGWYIWAGEGEPAADDDFFLPVHVEHLASWCSQVLKYLALPPGWRFLFTDDYEDVWFDPKLINIE